MRRHLMYSAITVAVASSAGAANPDILTHTPIGSWQVREQVTTEPGGKQKVAVMRTSLLGTETRGGQDLVWMEVETASYEVSKSGQRKPDGDVVIMKVLMRRSVFREPPTAIQNLMTVAEEVIMQTGDEDPVRMNMKAMGGLAGAMLQGGGAQMDYSHQEVGRESVTTPAGTFDCLRIQGTGSSEIKVVFKKIKTESRVETWLSTDVPFGVVKQTGTTTTGGKAEGYEATLLEYGMSGAVSKITKEPVG